MSEFEFVFPLFALLVGGPVARPVIGTLIWSLALVAIFAPLAVMGFKRRGT